MTQAAERQQERHLQHQRQQRQIHLHPEERPPVRRTWQAAARKGVIDREFVK